VRRGTLVGREGVGRRRSLHGREQRQAFKTCTDDRNDQPVMLNSGVRAFPAACCREFQCDNDITGKKALLQDEGGLSFGRITRPHQLFANAVVSLTMISYFLNSGLFTMPSKRGSEANVLNSFTY